jgi:hypothetical protein
MGENSSLKECIDQDSALNSETMLFKAMEAVRDFPSTYGCQKPCKQSSYSFSIGYYHQTSYVSHGNLDAISNESFHLAFYYDSLTIEEHFETLVYDTGSMLVAAGGNLGLFLGFSCLSILLSAISFLKQMVKKMCKVEFVKAVK